ncbi:MAG TPA: DNA/RNA non-specific endonuclease [Aeromicrobium sp.]|nr:DNA/RNA non-specific endonuclease [Aeromicrobium sp.]
MACIAISSLRVAPSLALTNGGSITALGDPLTEDFDSLGTAGATWLDNTTIPGWYSTRAAYVAGTGSSNTGTLYSFGVAGTNAVTDRALGSVASGSTLTVYQAARLTNNTGATITSLEISYTGEQWRTGGNAAAHSLTFQYQVASSGVVTGANTPATGWTTHAPLSFTGPIATPTAAALDGNAAANRVAIAATLSVTVNPGQEIWLRWQDPDDAGSDHGLAIDDFSVVAHGGPGDTAPGVTGTAPADSAINVPVASTIAITFSESVTATAGAFSIQCPLGVPQAFTQSASPASSFTLTPASPLPANTTCTVTVAADQVTDADLSDPPNQMAADFTFSFTTASTPPPVATNVIINEVDSDTPDADVAEFVELYDGGAGNTSLHGLVLVFFNGSNDSSYAAFDLDGFSTNATGYFTIGNAGVPGVVLTFGGNLLQNGQDAVALFAGNATDFPNGTLVTTANLQDAVVYDTDDADDAGLLVLLNADQPQVNENGGGSGTTQSSGRCPNGAGGARNTSLYQQATPSPGGPNTCALPPQPSNSMVVISQVYGGGGNAGATYLNDFVELYNRGAQAVDLTGWSLQYASANGSGWGSNLQPLGGSIAPGEYLLVSLGSGGPEGASLPAANITGLINMGAASGKIALTNAFDELVGNCPLGDARLMDLVGYGTADCREGTTTAPGGSSTASMLRLGNGATDTDRNGSDFVLSLPSPRRTAPIVELGPLVLLSDPRKNGINAPRDATLVITFTEAVDVVGAWFDISCAVTGQHNSATFAGGGQQHSITPNVDFAAGEQCTVTLFRNQIHDQDLDDIAPDTDTLPADHVFAFTVATGTPPPYPATEHLAMGNPSGATPDLGNPANFLMQKPEYTLSYHRGLGRPNWVSWHLSDEWIGTLTRVDTFRPDPRVPPDWYRVQAFDFTNSGFDRGHMVPNADRDKETSIPINQATFLMTNMLAQAPDNNQGPWAALENYLRTLLPSDEIYIVAGGAGTGGTGSEGGLTMTLANGHVTVPAFTWKVALVIPKGFSDVSRVSCSSRTIAVIMPNVQGIRADPWENYLTTVDAVEVLTGYNLFSELPQAIQTCVEAGVNGNNPPLDETPPSITIASPSAVTYVVGQTVIANYSCSDIGSGLATCAGPVPSGQVISTSVPGAGVFTVTASDIAGNTTSRSVSYSVGYSICALYDQTKAHKAGSTVPIRLQVCNNSGTSVSSPAISVVATGVVRLADNVPGVLEDSGKANPDNQFRFVPAGGGAYVFNLSTKGLAPGTYALVFMVASDPTPHTVQFQVR